MCFVKKKKKKVSENEKLDPLSAKPYCELTIINILQIKHQKDKINLPLISPSMNENIVSDRCDQRN